MRQLIDEDGEEPGERDMKSLSPPPYEEGDGQLPQVTIPPLAPAQDASPVDIRVDEEEDDGMMNGSAGQESLAGRIAARPPFLAPSRVIRSIATSPRSAIVQVTGFEFEATKSSLPPKETDLGSQASIGSSNLIDSEISAATSSIPARETPALTPGDMLQARPHPNAIILADQLRWIVVANEAHVRSDPVEVSPALDLDIDTAGKEAIWQYSGEVHIPIKEQRSPICSAMVAGTGSNGAEAPHLQFIEDFQVWRSTKGSAVLSSKAEELKSAVSPQDMEAFRSQRLNNPRPGLTGKQQYEEAIETLLKVVGNAANGEVRLLSVHGKAISKRLGFDSTAERILGSLGFEAEGEKDANGLCSLIKPPDMSSPVWQTAMRRAWLEIVSWHQYSNSGSVVTSSLKPELRKSIPLTPQYATAAAYLGGIFDVSEAVIDRVWSIQDNIPTPFHLLGADPNSSEAIVEQCYVANTHHLSPREKAPYYAALQEVALHFRESTSELIETRLGIEKSSGAFSEKDVQQAFSKIGIEVDSIEHSLTIESDFVLSVYMGAINSVAANKEQVQNLKDALETISQSRGKPEAMEQQVIMPVELSLEKAYEILEVTEDIDDDFICSVFSLVISDAGKTTAECIEALRVIMEDRKSAMLRKVYREAIGEKEEVEEIALDKPIGLNNIGNTCYLNSVLQYFFAIRQLRERVLRANDVAIDPAKTSALLRIGGRQISQREIERSQRFVRQLAQLFANMTTSPASAVTPERELAYLALVSSRVEEISEVADVADTVQAIPDKHENSTLESTMTAEPVDMQAQEETALVRQESAKSPVSSTEAIDGDDEDGIRTPPLPDATEEINTAPPLPPRPGQRLEEPPEVGQRRNSLMQLGAQQDVSECLDNVMFQIEVALTANEQAERIVPKSDSQDLVASTSDSMEVDETWPEDEDSLRRLFLGRTLQQLELVSRAGDEVKTDSTIHTKREVFTILPIDVVEEGRDIYDGLDGFFEEEVLTGSGGEPIRRTVTLTDAPRILQIQLQRVQYDRIRGAYKSQAHLDVGQTLYLDRYLDFDPDNADDQARLEKRREGREARKRVAALRARIQSLEPNTVSSARTLHQTGAFLATLGTTTPVPLNLQNGSDDAAPTVGVESIEKAGAETSSLKELAADNAFGAYLLEEATLAEKTVRDAIDEIKQLKESVSNLWSNETRLEYVLASVFMHRGEASHGHYFLNQRQLTASDQQLSSSWYKYNDQSVTPIDWRDVHHDSTGATPYLLCWIRRDKLDHFDTLCRKYEMPADAGASTIPTAPVLHSPSADITMDDGDNLRSIAGVT